jgi:hypothetical protein
MRAFLHMLAGALEKSAGHREIRRLLYLAFLLILVLVEFIVYGKERRSFVFYTLKGNDAVVENRMLARSSSKELNIRRYVEEAVLGPVDLDLSPLLTKGTTVEALLYRDGLVYVDFSSQAALPPLAEKGNLYHNLLTLEKGIKRNFPFVKDIHFFIGGNEAFAGKFRENSPEL